MRELRLLRRDADGGSLLLEAVAGEEQFHLPVNDVLRKVLHEDGPTETPAAPAATGARPVDASPLPISPRDIQLRVRSGEDPQEIADEFGVEVDRVLRFAGAVVEERARIAGEARRARARRNDTHTVYFGEAVDERYAAHGIVPTMVTWDSYRREDGEWIIVARWEGGEGEHEAEWIFQRTSRMVTPIDETATDLLSDRPIRPVAKPNANTRPALSVAPPLAPGVVAFPPMPDARTGPVPVVDEVFDQESTLDAPRFTPPTSQPIAPAAVAEPTLDFDAPPLPLGIVDPPAPPITALPRLTNLGVTRRDETDDERAARARIPSWDDILLGVRPKSE